MTDDGHADIEPTAGDGVGRRLRRALGAYPIGRPRSLFRRSTLKDDGMAGLVLGVESVPDSLASGLLAGVNPVYGLYGYLYGTIGGALFASTTYMAVQATGAMSIIVADVDLAGRDDPSRSLFTLSIATGIVMIVAGLLRLGGLLRFVSNSVMTGFITAVGANIVLGQLGDFTGYDADGSGRITRALNTVFHFWEIDGPTITVGLATVVLIVVLQRTALGALGLVVAIATGSAIAALFNAFDHNVSLVSDIADVPASLPFITAPVIGELPGLLVPAASLAFVGLVQGAAVSAGFPNADGSPSDISQDFVGQGAGNVVSGLFQGMPVGGSMSATSLVSSAGAEDAWSAALRRGDDGADRPPARRCRRLRRDAVARRPADGDRRHDDQAPPRHVGRAHRRRPADGHGDHARAHDGDPAAVLGAGRSRDLGDPVRRRPVESAHDQAVDLPSRRTHRAGRPARHRSARGVRSSSSRTARSSSPPPRPSATSCRASPMRPITPSSSSGCAAATTPARP